MKDFNYTKVMESSVEKQLSKLETFYCREDVEEAVKEVKRTDKSDRKFRTNDLINVCNALKLEVDIERLLRDKVYQEAVLRKIPTRKEKQDELAEIFHSLYRKVPSPEDYMERIVRRLAPEYQDDTVRTVILKKFIKGVGMNWTVMRTSAICDWAIEKMPPEDRKRYEEYNGQGLGDEQVDMIIKSLDDSIFSEDHLKVDLSAAEYLDIMMGRVDSLMMRQEVTDRDGNNLVFGDLIISDDTRNYLNSFCKEYDLQCDPENKNLNIFRNIQEMAESEETGEIRTLLEDESFVQLIKSLENDFKEQMKHTFYRTERGRIGKAADLYKTDVRDAMANRGLDWKLLQVCDDLAKGRFKTNSGKTRVYLYYFAFMFGMKVKLDKTDEIDPSLDMEKNLFEDYYCDNVIRYLDESYSDPRTVSSYEKEPDGAGINYKNYVEVIYLYYMNHEGLNLTPGERIKRAEKKVEQCRRAAKNKEINLHNTEDRQNTSFFRESYINQVVELEEDLLVDFIVNHYLIIPPIDTTRILVSSEKVTVEDEMDGIMEDLNYIDKEETMQAFANLYSATAFTDSFAKKEAKKFIREASRAESVTFPWEFSDLLREKYGNEKEFCKIVDRLDERVGKTIKSLTEVVNAEPLDRKTTTRSRFIALYLNLYMRDTEGAFETKSFPEVRRDFFDMLNHRLEESRFQTLSEKNIIDMYILFSLYQYLIEYGD
ncbi:MAG: hypothetical protein LUE92_01930 [Clostridiales bacterium]|nr:hypothetical protein [Clostridiales bacterium]